jgi:peptide chain release factor subunit 1
MKLEALIDRLVDFTPTTSPVISLYLDGRPDQHGREQYGVFVRKELAMRSRSWPLRSRERESFHRDVDRILAWLHDEARPSANGIAIFACADADFFEAVQLDVPIEEHALFVGATPRVFPLLRLADRYRRCAAVVIDSHSARIFVFGLGEIEGASEIEGEKMRRTDAGGWSQARYQRHVDHHVAQHVKDVVDALDDITRTESIGHVVVAGDDVVVPLVRAQLPKHLADTIVDVIRLEMTAGEPEIMDRTLAAVRAATAREDAEMVTAALDALRAGGLGAAGVNAVRTALENGQVHELLISKDVDAIKSGDGTPGPEVVEEFVARARRTSALVRFVDDHTLLEPVEGVAARLRYQIGGKAA